MDKGQSAVNPNDKPSLIKKSRGFKTAYLNIRSLIKHMDEFRIYLRNEQFDIISVNETMLHDTVCDYEIDLKGYEIVRMDRNRDGGGVIFYIRNSINY